MELIDRTILGLSRAKLEYRALGRPARGRPERAAVRRVRRVTATPRSATSSTRLQRRGSAHGHGYHFLRAETAAEQDALTKVRKAGLGLLMAASEGRTRPAAFVEDTAVAPEHLADYVARFQEIFAAHGLQAGFYGHCSVGCLHIRPFLDLSRPDQVEHDAARSPREVVDLVAEFDGVNSSEHGDGRIRSPFNPRIFGDELYGAMREVKRAVRPGRRVQPGRDGRRRAARPTHIRDAELPAARAARDPLRLPRGLDARGRRPLPADRRLPQGRQRCDVPVLHGHARGGARHPRARQRAGQGAVSEPDPGAALGDERLHEILDLCLECKACKSECPLSVDMATLKSEFLVALQRDPRHAAALAPVRLDPNAQSPRKRDGAAVEPARAARPAGEARGNRPPPPTPALRARDTGQMVWNRQAAQREARAARRGRLPRRLVHDLHRARRRARRDRAARRRGLRRAARERRLLRAGVDLQGPARRRARQGRGADRAAGG